MVSLMSGSEERGRLPRLLEFLGDVYNATRKSKGKRAPRREKILIPAPISSFAGLLQGLLEHVRLHHGGGEHHRRLRDRVGGRPQALPRRQAHQAAEEERQHQDPALHLCPIHQGMLLLCGGCGALARASQGVHFLEGCEGRETPPKRYSRGELGGEGGRGHSLN